MRELRTRLVFISDPGYGWLAVPYQPRFGDPQLSPEFWNKLRR